VKVIVQPQNGYINRIQALVSSALLAQEISAECEVQWVPDSTAPANPAQIFGTEFLQYFAPKPQVWDLKPYLNYDVTAGIVTLAGLDRGEQEFMPDLRALLQSGQVISEIRISAGGKFSLSDIDSTFTATRSNFYRRELKFTESIESFVANELASQGEYLGLHLRYSDRNHQAPTRKKTLKAIQDLSRDSGIRAVFIATDTPSDLPWWKSELQSVGLSAWWVQAADLPRDDSRGGLAAMVDWRVLGKSRGVVYFSESSFGEEAAVASGFCDISIGLGPSNSRAFWVRLRTYLAAGITYPRRHFFSE
jgi:hypothetical protein